MNVINKEWRSISPELRMEQIQKAAGSNYLRFKLKDSLQKV